MQIQVIDFPSDIYGEAGNLRGELVKCLHRASVSDSAAEVLTNIVKFTITKLKEAKAEREAYKAGAEPPVTE